MKIAAILHFANTDQNIALNSGSYHDSTAEANASARVSIGHNIAIAYT